jgi:hypothetical protein
VKTTHLAKIADEIVSQVEFNEAKQPLKPGSVRDLILRETQHRNIAQGKM